MGFFSRTRLIISLLFLIFLTFAISPTPVTAASKPQVLDNLVSKLQNVSVQLNGYVNPSGLNTTYRFRYGTSTSYGKFTGSSKIGSETSWLKVNAGLFSLSPNTTYYYRLEASNSAGTTYGEASSFRTYSSPQTTTQPSVSTGAAYKVTSSSAMLSGTINPNGTETRWYFRYGKTSCSGYTERLSIVGSREPVPVSTTISSLEDDTTYHYCLYGSNSKGQTIGAEKTFTTFPAVNTVPLVINVDKTTVNFDWTAMSAANTYTLAVALSDEVGNVDMSTLALLDMGSRKTFSTSGLTSGMIFYATILADTAQGLEVSNTCQFMPIAGTVTFPEANGVLMQVDDPDGIGNITVSGNVNGDTVNITQIAGDDGSGPFVLTLVDDKPVSYVKGGLTTNFTSLADGSLVVRKEQSRAEASAQEVLDCQERIEGLMALSDKWFGREYRRLTGMIDVLTGLGFSAIGAEGSFHPAGQKLAFLVDILQGARKSLIEEDRTKTAALKQEYEECSSEPDPDPDPDPDNPVIIIDTTCPIPAGAILRNWTGTSAYTSWHLSGNRVGPFKSWWPNASGSLYLAYETCSNAEGQSHGWDIHYFENGNMQLATHYKNGVKDGHQYDFYEDGTLYIDNTFVNGVNTYRIVYHEDGSLKWYLVLAIRYDATKGSTLAVRVIFFASLDLRKNCYSRTTF